MNLESYTRLKNDEDLRGIIHAPGLNKEDWVFSDELTMKAIELIEDFDLVVNPERFLGVYTCDEFDYHLGVMCEAPIGGLKVICISSEVINKLTNEGLMRILRHEVAHLMIRNHGYAFKTISERMKTHGTRIMHDFTDYVRDEFKHEYIDDDEDEKED